MKKLSLIGFALALGACAAQQNALQSTGASASEQEAAQQDQAAASRQDQRREDDKDYVSSLERRDVTGSRINRVRRRGEAEEDKTAGKRVETVSREEIEIMEQRSGGAVISGKE